jgi:hypothetical protein
MEPEDNAAGPLEGVSAEEERDPDIPLYVEDKQQSANIPISVIDESETKVIGYVFIGCLFPIFTISAKIYTQVNTIQADVWSISNDSFLFTYCSHSI